MNVPTIYPGFVGPTMPWAPDGHAVVLGNTFLPLDASDAQEYVWRTKHRAVAEIDVYTHAVTVITRRDSLRAVRWNAASNTVELAPGAGLGFSNPAPTRLVRYRKTRGVWREVQSSEPRAPEPILTVEQGMNTPPRLVAVTPVSGAQHARGCGCR